MYRENQYFAALSFSHPLLSDLDSVQEKLFGKTFETVSAVVTSEFLTARHLHFVTTNPYHRVVEETDLRSVKKPKTRKIGNQRFYLYDSYLLRIKLGLKHPYYFLAVPFRKMLKDCLDASAPKLESEKLSFHSLNLIKTCNHLSNTELSCKLKITRINLQTIVETSGLKSVALYGDNVVLSELYDQIKMYTTPSAIRVFLQEPDKKNSFAINTDKVGNWSFYLRHQPSLTHIERLLNEFYLNKLLETSYGDPRRRKSYLNSDIE